MVSILKKTRLASGYSVEEVSQRLKIKKSYIIALEEGNVDIIPNQVYVVGYTKLYAALLGIAPPINVTERSLASPSLENITISSKFKIWIFVVLICIAAMIIIIYSLISANNIEESDNAPILTEESSNNRE